MLEQYISLDDLDEIQPHLNAINVYTPPNTHASTVSIPTAPSCAVMPQSPPSLSTTPYPSSLSSTATRSSVAPSQALLKLHQIPPTTLPTQYFLAHPPASPFVPQFPQDHEPYNSSTRSASPKRGPDVPDVPERAFADSHDEARILSSLQASSSPHITNLNPFNASINANYYHPHAQTSHQPPQRANYSSQVRSSSAANIEPFQTLDYTPFSQLTPQLKSIPTRSNSHPLNIDPSSVQTQSWLSTFCLHSLSRKHSDFNQIEEWATAGRHANETAKLLASHFKNTPIFNMKLYSALFFYIKRQLLRPFVESLVPSLRDLSGVEWEHYSIRMFINLLLSNCDSDLRIKLMQLISISHPIPLTEFILNRDTFTQEFTPEPCSILEDKFLFFSFGVGQCKGKSTLLNRIFGTTFETSRRSQFFKGTIDYQGDAMFVPSRGVAVVDAHGDVDSVFKQGLFKLADGIIMHTSKETWEFYPHQVRREIEDAAECGVKLMVVLVRDTQEELDSCIPTSKLSGLQGSGINICPAGTFLFAYNYM